MKLWKASYEWLREYKPNESITRINGTNDILSVITKQGKVYTLIELSFVNGMLVPVEEEYSFSEVES